MYIPAVFDGLSCAQLTAIAGVDPVYLNQRNAWSDTAACDEQALHLATLFVENIARFDAAPAIVAAGPRL